jgi:hypothetical protein
MELSILLDGHVPIVDHGTPSIVSFKVSLWYSCIQGLGALQLAREKFLSAVEANGMPAPSVSSLPLFDPYDLELLVDLSTALDLSPYRCPEPPEPDASMPPEPDASTPACPEPPEPDASMPDDTDEHNAETLLMGVSAYPLGSTTPVATIDVDNEEIPETEDEFDDDDLMMAFRAVEDPYQVPVFRSQKSIENDVAFANMGVAMTTPPAHTMASGSGSPASGPTPEK